MELQSTDAKDSRFADLPGLKRREMKLPSGERKRDELFLGSAADFPGRFEGELLRRERIVRTSERYPYIRVEEILEMGNGGENRVLQTRAIAADHVMILVDEREKDAVLAVCEDLGMKLRRWLPQSSILLVETSDLSLDGVDDAIDALRSRLGNWITVEADQVFFPAGELVPNDPSWGAQWNLDRIEAPSAWGATTGSKEVVVAIVDTGARLDHLDLVANLWRNPGETLDGTDNDGNGYIDDVHGYDFLLDQPLAVNNDTFNHGTHVAGIVGAVGNNEEGIAGVSWDVSLLILRAGEETFLESALIEAIDYATALRRDQGVRIVASNHSYGGQGDPVRMTATKSAIARHRDAGILFVAAAGNEGEDNDILATWPANYDLTDYPSVGDWNNVISVAASNRTDGKASFSNYGVETVHLAAPGARILSTSADRGNNGYATFSGTSMAAPHVTGAAALVQAANWGLDGEAIRKILLGSVDILPQWEEISTTGGRLNLGKAVAEARRYPDVRIASPVGPLFLGEGSDLVIIAEAQVEGEGEVTHVAFYANGLPIGIAGEGASGWSTTWEQIPSGAFVLTAVASADWDGVTRTMISEPVHVTVGGIEVDDAQADSVVVSAGWRSEVFDDAMGGTSHLFFRPRQTTGPPHNRHPGGADGHESFRFNADLPDDGEWKVEMWWPKYPDAYEETPIEIFHKEGSTALVLNQREGYGRWNDLGTYRFSPGVAGVVVKTVERQNYMLADAVRFSRLQAGPLVSVVATGPIADFDVGPGSFTLTRTRAEGVLDVGFALTGEAVEGEEYEAVEKWIQFDEGAHTASLSIVPLEEPGFTGEKSIVLELLEGADYRLTAPQKATIFLVAELSPIEPVIEWASPSPIAYGTPLSVLQLGAMETSDISGTFVYVPDHGTILDAGVHELQLTFFPDEEDRFLTVSLERSLEVQPGLLKIIAEDKEWEPGQVFPELTVLLEGFANGDGEADLETSFTLFTSAGPETPPGTYPIQASGAEAPNYSISFIDGLFTIPEINFSLWMSRFIEDDEGVIVVLDEADTSGDGVSDLLKYALDLDPRAADVSVMSDTVPGLPLLRRGEVDGIDHLFLAYRRNPVKTDLTYRVEFSDDLESWLPLIDPYDEIIGNDNGIEIREAGVPLDGNLKFLRLKVTRSDQESVGVR